MVQEARDILSSDMNHYTEKPEWYKPQLRFIFCGLLWRDTLPSKNELMGLVKTPVDSSNFPSKCLSWGYNSFWEKRDYFIRTKDNFYYYSDLDASFSLVGRTSSPNSSKANTVGSLEIENMLSMFDRYFPNNGDISLLTSDQLATVLVISEKTKFERGVPRGYNGSYRDDDFKEATRTNIETNRARQGVAARLFEIQRKYTKSINDGWVTSSSTKKAVIDSKFQTTFNFFCAHAQSSAEMLKPQLPLDDQGISNALDYLSEFRV